MRLQLITAGESHGPGLTLILEGIPAGLPLDETILNRDLARRQHGFGAGPRMKIEQDRAQILGGVMDGKTTGAPLAVWIENRDHVRWKDKPIRRFTIPRPGHADLSGVLKYGYDDLRPALERASARETAARVAGGAICRHLLAQFGICIGGYVVSIGEIRADLTRLTLEERIERALTSEVACPDEAAAQTMQARIREIMQARDTLGGVIEVAALGVPPGLGSYVHWERRLDARIAAAVMSIPAIKGVEIGPAFENAARPGTQVHDPIVLQGTQLQREGINSGGLEGGITTGQPILIRAAMKPIATTLTPQRSVDLSEGKAVETRYERSDFCPVPRAVVIVEAMLAYVLADALLEKLGGDSLAEMLPRFAALPRPRLSDVRLRSDEPVFWKGEQSA